MDSNKEVTPAQRFAAYSRGGTSNKLISLRLPEDLLEALAEISQPEGLSMSDTIRMALWRGVRASDRPNIEHAVSDLTDMVSDLQAQIGNINKSGDSL